MSTSKATPTPGSANNSSWNSSGFAFPPNTNTLDPETMPSEQAQLAREKSAEIMAALKSGDTERANALLGKDTSHGRILPGVGWLKRKMNKNPAGKLEGVEATDDAQLYGVPCDKQKKWGWNSAR